MDPYLAKLIGRTEPQQKGVLKRYWKGERTFFLVRGNLTAEQRVLLRRNMEALRGGWESLHPDPIALRRTESAS
jgi:hypothetical protein